MRDDVSRDEERHWPSNDGDDDLDALMRAVAHAPPGTPRPPVTPGATWGEGGRYVIVRLLGRGGMGVVYAAEDTLLGRAVALKVLDDGGDGGTPQRDRLLREARIAAKVEHQRIARVYDVGEHAGAAFVAMELVRGVTLRAWVTTGERSMDGRLSVIGQIAEGLAALHGQGVFHRDLKPENVMITDDGAVRLLDFGLARPTGMLVDDGHPMSPEGDGRALRSWGLSGTVGYMAPEQCAGRPLDARVDVFALGVITFELISGRRPFEGDDARAIVEATLRAAPDFSGDGWVRAPQALRALTLHMLARDPAERLPDGGSVVRELAALRAPSSRRSRLGAALIAGVITGGVALAGWWSIGLPKSLPPPPPGMALVDVGTMTVGKSVADVDRECQSIGASCDRVLMMRETPSQRVTVSPFFLDVDEVTNAAMASTLEALRSSLTVAPDEDPPFQPRYVHWIKGLGRDDELLADLHPDAGGIEYDSAQHYRARPGRETQPAVQTTWHGAKLFCSTRGKVLPSEDEWEAAARGRDDRPFPWGQAPVRCGDVTIPRDGLVPMPADCPAKISLRAVGTSRQDVTPEGIRDLAGNAAEWVDAVYVEGDRTARGDGPALPKVLRGGSFFESFMARPSGRNRRVANAVGHNLAFRCAVRPSH